MLKKENSKTLMVVNVKMSQKELKQGDRAGLLQREWSGGLLEKAAFEQGLSAPP